MIETQGLIEQHIHGAFGCDFMNCSEKELFETADLLAQNGVSAFFPTVMTDDIEKIKDRISLIKSAKAQQKEKTAKIAGIHLEGPFINPEKSGIHEKKYILPLQIDLYKKFEDEIIKIITLAPELDKNREFIKYLKSKNVKISLGHSLGTSLEGINQVTHLYNAMGAFSHRGNSTVVSVLYNNDIYIEIIADSMHVSDEVLDITFRLKPKDKIILISDALPLAHSIEKEGLFAGQKIYNKNGKLVNSEGVFAGSSKLLCDIVKNLADKKILAFSQAVKYASDNPLNYHNLKNNLKVYWNDDFTINKTEFI